MKCKMIDLLPFVLLSLVFVPHARSEKITGLVLEKDFWELQRWETSPEGALEEGKWESYLEWAKAFQQLKHPQREKLLIRLANQRDDFDLTLHVDAKLYILLRIAFDVTDNVILPPTIRWTGNEKSSLLWPLGYDATGELKVMHGCEGSEGPSYNPLYDYTALRKIFKLREIDQE